MTICTPSFNRADLLPHTLDSLLAQTDPRWEALVVDDGSTDRSRAVAAEYAARDPRIRLIERHRDPKGACTCRNIAVMEARGDLVLFLDSDDLLAPHCVAQRVRTLDARADLDFAIFPMLLFRDHPSDADRLWNVDRPDDDLRRLLRLDAVCQGTGTLWRRDAFRRLGLWSEELLLWQDVELHVRAFARGFRYIKRFDLPPDAYLRESPGSLSRGGYQSRPKLESRARVVRGALALLRDNGRAELVPELRYLCASVVVGATTSGNLDLAADVRRWARGEGVLTPADARRLRAGELVRAARLDRVPLVRRIRERFARTFITESTLGTVAYRPPPPARASAAEPGAAGAEAPSVSVVIPTKNGAQDVRACIESILAQSIQPFEIIVIDSGSTDETLSILAEYRSVCVITIPADAFDHGDTRNLGVSAARGDYVLLTVQDARAASDTWIEQLLDGFTDDDVVGVCGAQVVPHERSRNPVEWFRPVDSPTRRRVQWPGRGQFDALSPSAKLEACGWDNVTAMYRRSALQRMPFRRTTYAEDAAWAAAALRAGHALVYAPAARVFHHHFETPEYTFKRTVAAMYVRHREFGYLYERPPVLMPAVRAASILLRERTLTVGERVHWLRYNVARQRALRRAVRAFRSALARGDGALAALHERCCGRPPEPDRTRMRVASV